MAVKLLSNLLIFKTVLSFMKALIIKLHFSEVKILDLVRILFWLLLLLFLRLLCQYLLFITPQKLKQLSSGNFHTLLSILRCSAPGVLLVDPDSHSGSRAKSSFLRFHPYL